MVILIAYSISATVLDSLHGLTILIQHFNKSIIFRFPFYNLKS